MYTYTHTQQHTHTYCFPGDYSILFRMKGGLLRTVFPFLAYMYLVAFVGFFVGASIGIHCMEANKWVLSLASGFFLYVGLVNLVRLLYI